jgi:AraC-like DNA-binding protein
MSLNKPAADTDAAATRWSGTPRWYLWDGGFFLAGGRGQGIVAPHAHHAIQIVVAIDGDIGIRGKQGEWRMGRGAIVRQDVVHSYNPNGALGAMLFVDPESVEGVWLRTSLRDDITLVPDARLGTCAAELQRFLDQPFESMDVRDLISHCVHALCAGAPPSRRLDPRVTRVLAAIRDADELRISIEEAAGMAFLSPSRFAHLFKQQVGLPFRRYMLWRKLTRAMLVIGRERTIAAAAHAADFADAAHLTRTFYQMVGIAPSLLMRGEFFEIPSPFEVPAPSQANA